MCDPYQAEVNKNFERFKEILPSIIHEQGKYALMRHSELVEIYETFLDAFRTGEKFFEDRLYSVQPITDKPIDLGFRSRAVHSR
jgi:hypothetical protein